MRLIDMKLIPLFSSILTVVGISFCVIGLTMQSITKVHLPKTSQTPHCLMHDWQNEIIITINKEQKVEVKLGDVPTISHSFQYRPSADNSLTIEEVSLWQRHYQRVDVVVLADKSLSFGAIRDILYSLNITQIRRVHFIVRF